MPTTALPKYLSKVDEYMKSTNQTKLNTVLLKTHGDWNQMLMEQGGMAANDMLGTGSIKSGEDQMWLDQLNGVAKYITDNGTFASTACHAGADYSWGDDKETDLGMLLAKNFYNVTHKKINVLLNRDKSGNLINETTLETSFNFEGGITTKTNFVGGWSLYKVTNSADNKKILYQQYILNHDIKWGTNPEEVFQKIKYNEPVWKFW
jgi:hypothetical protein